MAVVIELDELLDFKEMKAVSALGACGLIVQA